MASSDGAADPPSLARHPIPRNRLVRSHRNNLCEALAECFCPSLRQTIGYRGVQPMPRNLALLTRLLVAPRLEVDVDLASRRNRTIQFLRQPPITFALQNRLIVHHVVSLCRAGDSRLRKGKSTATSQLPLQKAWQNAFLHRFRKRRISRRPTQATQFGVAHALVGHATFEVVVELPIDGTGRFSFPANQR